jgi:hypothetical protein
MKKTIYSLLIILSFLMMNNNSNAQAFQKGNMNMDIGLGFGAYGTTTTTFTIDFLGIPITVTDEDGAASFMVPITVEYGVSDRIGIGFQLGFANYFIDNEDSTETTESVRSVDFALKFNFHLLNSDKNDLFVGLGIGGSSVNWRDLSGEEFTGTGSIFTLHITDRIFINDNVGILFNLGYTGYNYSKIESSNDLINWELKWTLKGINFGTGLALKI